MDLRKDDTWLATIHHSFKPKNRKVTEIASSLYATFVDHEWTT